MSDAKIFMESRVLALVRFSVGSPAHDVERRGYSGQNTCTSLYASAIGGDHQYVIGGRKGLKELSRALIRTSDSRLAWGWYFAESGHFMRHTRLTDAFVRLQGREEESTGLSEMWKQMQDAEKTKVAQFFKGREAPAEVAVFAKERGIR